MYGDSRLGVYCTGRKGVDDTGAKIFRDFNVHKNLCRNGTQFLSCGIWDRHRFCHNVATYFGNFM